MATAPFFGDPAAEAPVFGQYAVLLGSLTATVPTAHAGAADFTLNNPGTVTDEWDPVGSLDDATPFDDGTESIDASDHTAAGFGVYATTYTNQKETRSFTAKETTLVTMGLIYDTTSLTDTSGVLSGTLKRRDPSKQFLAGFYRENANGLMERYVTSNYAYINSVTRNFSNNEKTCTVELIIVPTANDELYAYYKGAKA
jgi:hypothetical protein